MTRVPRRFGDVASRVLRLDAANREVAIRMGPSW
jgi:hypothetical protein